MRPIIKIIILLTCLAQTARAAVPGNQVLIHIHYPESLPGDSLMLYRAGERTAVTFIRAEDSSPVVAARQPDGWFNLRFAAPDGKSRSAFYIYLELKRKKARADGSQEELIASMLPFYVARGGDSVRMEVKETPAFDPVHSNRHNFQYRFTGSGAKKYDLRYQVDSIAYHVHTGPLLTGGLEYVQDNHINGAITTCLAWLEKNRQGISDDDLALVRAYAIFYYRYEESLSLRSDYKHSGAGASKSLQETLISRYIHYTDSMAQAVPLHTRMFSKEFADAELGKQALIASIRCGPEFRDSLYQAVKTNYQGLLRDKLIYLYFIMHGMHTAYFQQHLEDALQIVQTPLYRERLEKMQRQSAGQPAFDFTLADTAGHLVHLSDFKGKVVFIDFWYTGCANCIIFYQKDLSAVERHFSADTNVVFITVSIDKSKIMWQRSILSEKYTSPHIVNVYTGGKGSDSPVIKYYQIHAYPQPVIIDQQQRIREYGAALRDGAHVRDLITRLRKE